MNLNTVLAFRSRATFLRTSNDAHLFVASKDDWIEETVSSKMSQDFLRKVLITTFPSAHEADHHSTAHFHECNAWLSFALCHCSNEHLIRLELRQSVRCLVHHHSSVRRTSSRGGGGGAGGGGRKGVVVVLVVVVVVQTV